MWKKKIGHNAPRNVFHMNNSNVTLCSLLSSSLNKRMLIKWTYRIIVIIPQYKDQVKWCVCIIGPPTGESCVPGDIALHMMKTSDAITSCSFYGVVFQPCHVSNKVRTKTGSQAQENNVMERSMMHEKDHVGYKHTSQRYDQLLQ